MIYLIDDKKSRQELLGWDENRLEKYVDILRPIYSYDQIKDNSLNSDDGLYANSSIILFHESFFNVVENKHLEDGIQIVNDLNNLCLEKGIPLIKFSGSNSSRSINGLNVGLPVSVLYQNLEFFLCSVKKNDNIDVSLKTLMFGENYNIEEILQLKKEIWETKFKFSPLLNNKIEQFNKLTGKEIDLKVSQNPIILKSLINE